MSFYTLFILLIRCHVQDLHQFIDGWQIKSKYNEKTNALLHATMWVPATIKVPLLAGVNHKKTGSRYRCQKEKPFFLASVLKLFFSVYSIFIVHYNTSNTKHNSDKEKKKMSQLKKMLLKVIYSVIFNLSVVSRNLFSSHSSGIFIVNAAFNKPFTTNLLSSGHFQSLSLTAEWKLHEWERDVSQIFSWSAYWLPFNCQLL